MPSLRSILAVVLLMIPGAALHAEIAGLPLAGRYVVVGLRTASDVAAPLSDNIVATKRELIGTELRIGEGLTWYREKCEARPGPPERSPAIVDRNLADLQLAPASNDARFNRNLIIDCLGRAASDIWHVLVVDQRVLVARSSPHSIYLVLEQPLAPGDVVLLKRRLKQIGFDPGTIDETLDESTRSAIAAYARKKGAPALLLPGILTVNLMNALAEDTR